MATKQNYREFLKTQIESKLSPPIRESFTEEDQFRLQFLHAFTVFQLEQLIEKEPRLIDENALLNFVNEHAKTPIKKASLDGLFERANVLFMDTDTFDGVSEALFFEGLEKGATLEDIKGLGARYGVVIPRRIKKEEMVAILIHRLGLKSEEKTSLMEKNVLDLEIFAKEKNVAVSIELKKKEMIAYLLDQLKLSPKSPVQSVAKKPATAPVKKPGKKVTPPAPVQKAKPAKPVKKAEPVETPSPVKAVKTSPSKVPMVYQDATLTEILDKHRFPFKSLGLILGSIVIILLLIGGTYWLMP
jgi:hypothetical protein